MCFAECSIEAKMLKSPLLEEMNNPDFTGLPRNCGDCVRRVYKILQHDVIVCAIKC